MRLCEWYTSREVLITGVSSDVGRTLLEKILRTFRNVKVYVVIRPRNHLSKHDRMRAIFQTPRFERLRQEQPDAFSRVKVLEGNLLYEKLALCQEDQDSLRKVSVVFHAAGPHEALLEFCEELPSLKAVVAVRSIFKYRGHIGETLQNEHVPDIPLALVRVPLTGPAYREPMPGFVDFLNGSTALMIGAGMGLGNSALEAELIPVDLVVNTVIAAAWQRGIEKSTDRAVVYNMPNIGCTWDELIKNGRRANRKFPYPTFGIRGMVSLNLLYWVLVILFEWLPSFLCDTIMALFGRKQRILDEHNRVRNALRSLEPITSRSWPAERNRVYQLEKQLSLHEQEDFTLLAEIDLETYILCAAASTRKYCVRQEQITSISIFRKLFYLLTIALLLYACWCRYETIIPQKIGY